MFNGFFPCFWPISPRKFYHVILVKNLGSCSLVEYTIPDLNQSLEVFMYFRDIIIQNIKQVTDKNCKLITQTMNRMLL